MSEKDFVTYEYKTVSVKAEEKARTVDLYESFGWESTGESASAGGVLLSLRRNRKIPHKQELMRTERKAEEQLEALRRLERAKTSGAQIFALVFGIIAALVLGGGMALALTLTANVGAFVAGIIIGVAGIALCAAVYPAYRKMCARASQRVLPAIDDGEQKLADLLERGNELLSLG